jgi:hypothetical protein
VPFLSGIFFGSAAAMGRVICRIPSFTSMVMFSPSTPFGQRDGKLVFEKILFLLLVSFVVPIIGLMMHRPRAWLLDVRHHRSPGV